MLLIMITFAPETMITAAVIEFTTVMFTEMPEAMFIGMTEMAVITMAVVTFTVAVIFKIPVLKSAMPIVVLVTIVRRVGIISVRIVGSFVASIRDMLADGMLETINISYRKLGYIR